jgi:hypothetical protein
MVRVVRMVVVVVVVPVAARKRNLTGIAGRVVTAEKQSSNQVYLK